MVFASTSRLCMVQSTHNCQWHVYAKHCKPSLLFCPFPATPPTAAVASQQFLKGAAPTYSDGTPYYTGANADDFEASHQVFIRKASALLREWPRSHGLRAVATNFQVG
jgi:hypothetical protein